MREEDTESTSKWQPVMVMLRRGGRLECACGALAVIVVGELNEQYNQIDHVDHWCQACYLKEQGMQLV
jgi:hypothetical protein